MYWNFFFFEASPRVSKMFLNKRISKKWRNPSIRCNKHHLLPHFTLHESLVQAQSDTLEEALVQQAQADTRAILSLELAILQLSD
jgi:hypothetical protein